MEEEPVLPNALQHSMRKRRKASVGCGVPSVWDSAASDVLSDLATRVPLGKKVMIHAHAIVFIFLYTLRNLFEDN